MLAVVVSLARTLYSAVASAAKAATRIQSSCRILIPTLASSQRSEDPLTSVTRPYLHQHTRILHSPATAALRISRELQILYSSQRSGASPNNALPVRVRCSSRIIARPSWLGSSSANSNRCVVTLCISRLSWSPHAALVLYPSLPGVCELVVI